jgi:hypothetical protein
MIAYSQVSLEKLRINKTTEMWSKKNLIHKDSLDKIKVNYKVDFYSPNLFIRIALFFFTIILASSALGLLTVISFLGSGSGEEYGIGIRLIIYGIVLLVILEVLIKNKKIYKAGIDDALLYMTLSYIIGGICVISTLTTYDNNGYSTWDPVNEILICLLWSFPILLAATIRYADMLIAALSYLCLFVIMCLLLYKAGPIAQALIPFAGILFSALAYFLIRKYIKMESFLVWENPMTLIELLSLFTFYISGNYLVVRELSELLFDKETPAGEDIPLAIIFYLFTALIPFAYIWKALQSKDRIMLRTGLIIFAMGILTFKYYYSLGHHEISLTLAGIVMVAFAALVMKYLKTPRHGLTTKEDIHENSLLNTDIETIIIAESFKTTGPEKGFDFGGGKFGGGGAGSSF